MISEKRINLSIFGLFLLTGFIAYSSIINSFFLSDDFAQIGKVLEGDLSTTWGRAHGGFFRPLFIFSLSLKPGSAFQRVKAFKQTRIIAFQSLQSSRDEVEFKSEADGLSIRLFKENAELIQSGDPACVEILSESKNSLRFRLKDCQDAEIFYFNAGRMVKAGR